MVEPVEPDADREVDLSDEPAVLPDQTSDDTDEGWGDWRIADDEARLRAELPPHWS